MLATGCVLATFKGGAVRAAAGCMAALPLTAVVGEWIPRVTFRSLVIDCGAAAVASLE